MRCRLNMSKTRKSQAAMEFLMTYGWAIVVVLAAIGALAYFKVISPQDFLTGHTIFQNSIQNIDDANFKLSDNSIEVAFQNNKGHPIIIPKTGTFVSLRLKVMR